MVNNRNTLVGLNDFLFGQLERLDDPEITPDQLELEVQRTKMIVETSRQIIANANTVLEAEKLKVEHRQWASESGAVKLIGTNE